MSSGNQNDGVRVCIHLGSENRILTFAGKEKKRKEREEKWKPKQTGKQTAITAKATTIKMSLKQIEVNQPASHRGTHNQFAIRQ